MHPLDELLRRTTAMIAGRRRLPESTYRLQFHAGFTFRDAERITPYLRDLGVTAGDADGLQDALVELLVFSHEPAIRRD